MPRYGFVTACFPFFSPTAFLNISNYIFTFRFIFCTESNIKHELLASFLYCRSDSIRTTDLYCARVGIDYNVQSKPFGFGEHAASRGWYWLVSSLSAISSFTGGDGIVIHTRVSLQAKKTLQLKYSSFFYVFKHRCTVHWRKVIMNKLFEVIWSNQYNIFFNKNMKLFLTIVCFFKNGCYTQSLTQESNSLVDHKLLKTEGSSFLPNMHLWCTQARMQKMLFDVVRWCPQ